MNKKPPTIRSIDEKSLHRIRARSKGKPTFADCYPDRKALGCLNPGAETLQLNEVLPGSKVYFRWICNKNPAHKWNGTPNNRNRYHCPHCYAEEKSEKVRRGKTSRDNLLKDKFPEHFAQLEVVLDSKGNELDKNYLGAKSFAKGIWNIGCGCGPFVARISDRTFGAPGEGCKSCANAKIGKRTREESIQKHGRLSETHATLASEWVAPFRESRRNIGLTPDTVSSTSGEKVLWRCSNLAPSGLQCGWEFSAIVADRALGNHNCPSCANRDTRGQSKRRLAVDVHGSVKDHPQLGPEFRRIVDSRYSHLTSTDISIESNYSSEWECSSHPGKFFVTSPSARFRYKNGELRISGCDSCSVEKRRAWGYTQGLERSGSLAEKFPELATAWIDCPSAPSQTPHNTSCGSRLIVNWLCLDSPEHPSWQATVCDRTNDAGCPECFNSRRRYFSRLYAIRNSGTLAATHPNIAQEFVHCESNQNLDANSMTFGSSETCLWKCGVHGETYTASVNHRVIGSKKCPTCAKLNITQSIRKAALSRSGSLEERTPELAAQWVAPVEDRHKNLTPEVVSPHSNVRVNWKCTKHKISFIWPATIGNRSNGYGCPKCKSSKGESLVSMALSNLKIRFTPQLYVKRLIELAGPTRLETSPILRYDFAIFNDTEELIALIEYHGIQHYEPVNFGGKYRTEDEIQKSFEEICERDRKKSALAMDLNIPLLVIPYWDQKEIHELLDVFLGSTLKIKQ